MSEFHLKCTMVILPQSMLLCWRYDYAPPKMQIDHGYVCVQVIDCLCASLSAEDKLLRAQQLSFLCGGISDEQVGNISSFCTGSLGRRGDIFHYFQD